MICAACFADNAESAAVCVKCGRELSQFVPEPGAASSAEAAATAEAAGSGVPAVTAPPVPDRPAAPPFRDPRPLKSWLTGLLVCFGGIVVASAVQDVAQIRLIDAISAESFASQEELMQAAEANDSRQQIIGVAYLILFIATVVIFGTWIHRVAQNARAISPEEFQRSPTMAVGSYFIPIVNLWIPYQAMSEIWRASRNPIGWRQDRAGAFLGWWWAIWLIANISANFTAAEAEGLAEIRRASQVSIASGALTLASVVMAVLLVTRLTAYQMHASTGVDLHKVFE